MLFKDTPLKELFESSAHAARMYAQEFDQTLEQRTTRYSSDAIEDHVMPKLEDLPHALLYRARVVMQNMEEVIRRATATLQAEYDALDTRGKINYHKEKWADLAKFIEYRDDDEEITEYSAAMDVHSNMITNLQAGGTVPYKVDE